MTFSDLFGPKYPGCGKYNTEENPAVTDRSLREMLFGFLGSKCPERGSHNTEKKKRFFS